MIPEKKAVSLFALVMLITGIVDGVSNLPSIAIFGTQLIFFFILAILLVLIPTGLVTAELCKQLPDEGGVYTWANKAFGSGFAISAIWLQWINILVWFPTCLTTLVGTLAYLIDPALSNNPRYLVGASVSLFWLMTLLNLRGVKHSSKLAAWATTLGFILPVTLAILLSIAWLLCGKPLALHVTTASIIPHLSNMSTWSSLTAIMTAFLGMELVTTHIKKVENTTIFSKALLIATAIIIITMGLGSLSIAIIVPHQNIVLVTGTIQAFRVFFSGFHIPWMLTVLGTILLFGSLGAIINFLISPTTGLAEAAHHHYLPKELVVENKHGVPYKLFLLQAVFVTVISTAFFLIPSVNGSYWLLMDLSTELYITMYILMFIAAIKILSKTNKNYIIPGGKRVAIGICLLGLLGCSIAFVVGFFPPSSINVGSHWHYEVLFCGGLILMCTPVWLFKKKAKRIQQSVSNTINGSLQTATDSPL